MSARQSLFFFFVDGIGLDDTNSNNPFSLRSNSGLSKIAECASWTTDHFCEHQSSTMVRRAIDASLGIEGLPQSGTGQSTLFTGVNCAELAGRHYGPFPHSTSKPLLASANLYHQVGPERCAFANAYPERFFSMARKRNRWSTTTRCCLDANLQLRTISDLEDENAIAADLTGKGLAGVAESAITQIPEQQTAKRIANLCDSYQLVVAEYFHSDKAGHKQSHNLASTCLESIDLFFEGLLEHLDFNQTTVVVTSDHGNLEDLSIKTHTLNPVPLLVRGPGAPFFCDVHDLTGIAGAISKSLTN